VKGSAPHAIQSEHLSLLPLRVEDALEMSEVLADPALHVYIGGEPLDAAGLQARYERLVAGSGEPDVTWLNWVLRLRAEGVLVGTVQATIDRSERASVAEIAWVVGRPWQGRGLATEAAGALVTWLRDQPVDLVVAHIHPDHRASAAVATAAGLTATEREYDGETRWELRFD
jgi:RimJ/RimL family protein N-acetyltransferase